MRLPVKLAMIAATLAASAQAATLTADQQTVVDKAKALLTRDFKDPLSAQWRGLFLRGDKTLCGEVNAKNSFGAYVGFHRFYVVLSMRDAEADNYVGADAAALHNVFVAMYPKACGPSFSFQGHTYDNGPRIDVPAH